MTRIVGIDIKTDSFTQFKIKFAACIVDTINQESEIIEELTSDQLLGLLQSQTIDVLALDHVNEIKSDPKLIDFLVDSQYPKIVQLSKDGAFRKSLYHLAKEVGISLRSKPNAVKSAIICALLAIDHGVEVALSKEGTKIRISSPNSAIQSTEKILKKRVSSNTGESTHRVSFQELQHSAYVSDIKQVIGYGKEAIVYRVEDINGRDTVVKTFRTYSSIAKRIHSQTYKASSAHIPLLMARDEAKYLRMLASNDVPAPSLYYRDDVSVGMEAIVNSEGQIAPTLSIVGETGADLHTVEDLLYQALDHLYFLFDEVDLVHGDYSANNLLVRDGELVVIDLSQAMRINTNTYVDTPQRLRMDQALDVVFRDLDGILTFFEREFRVQVDRPQIFVEFQDLIPASFADKVGLITQIWQSKFL